MFHWRFHNVAGGIYLVQSSFLWAAKIETAEKNLKTYRLSVCKQQKGCGL